MLSQSWCSTVAPGWRGPTYSSLQRIVLQCSTVSHRFFEWSSRTGRFGSCWAQLAPPPLPPSKPVHSNFVLHPVQYISFHVLWVFEYRDVVKNAGVLGCSFTNTCRISMFLGALERPGPLVYNAPKNIEIRQVFAKMQPKRKHSRSQRDTQIPRAHGN